MTRVLAAVEKGVQGIVAVLTLGILVVTLMQVISRYVFNAPFMWTEELARDLGIWLVLLCTAIVVREEGHLGFEILPERWKPVLRLVANIAIILFSVSLFKASIVFVKVSLGLKSDAIEMPLWILYVAIPIGLALMAVFGVENVIRQIASHLKSSKGEQS